MPLARRVKIVLAGSMLAALAATAYGMIWLAAERHRLTEDPVALASVADVRAACVVLLERSLTRGGSHLKSRMQLEATMVALRDGGSALARDDAHALLGELYELVAARVAAPDAANRDEVLAVLSETRPRAGDAALLERYRLALATHGIAAVAN